MDEVSLKTLCLLLIQSEKEGLFGYEMTLFPYALSYVI